jgi:Flp pilus assembly protein TadG
MATSQNYRMITLLREQKGMAAIWMAMLGTILVGITAFAVDIGYALVTQNELQNAADAAVLASTRQMGVTYLAMPLADQQDLGRDLTSSEQAQITAQATAATFANKASDVANLALSQGDISFGTWDFTAHTFTPTVTRPNAIRVTARRDGGANGPITTFFAGVLGVNTMNIATTSTAALGTSGGPSGPGVGDVPFAISSNWFEDNVANCDGGIQFSPTGPDGCAGWHTFDQNPANAQKLRATVDGLQDGSYTSPSLNPGYDMWEFTGGEVSSSYDNLIDLFDSKKHPDGNGGYEWDINLPVYKASNPTSCDNPSGSIMIMRYVKATVTEVKRNDIQAEIKCDAYMDENPDPNQNGGGGAGTTLPISPYPRLVS